MTEVKQRPLHDTCNLLPSCVLCTASSAFCHNLHWMAELGVCIPSLQ